MVLHEGLLDRGYTPSGSHSERHKSEKHESSLDPGQASQPATVRNSLYLEGGGHRGEASDLAACARSTLFHSRT
ncbi:hypothetical protein RRG08_029752 [Elysia crispata]|uniref:Uncharacterized protein n=1 Tax=Elysia crispata TaxID=231223 RepID=A0AAE1B5M1_9GAST|nr:hypothetical protein RRG08_029752 [Elysia crispata]